MVNQAQTSSRENGGLSGIFRKVNGDVNFRADVQDIIGHWNCVYVQDITYNGNTTQDEVINDLTSRGYLYNGTNLWAGGDLPGGGWTYLWSWGPSVPDNVNMTWEVRASITYDWLGPFDRHIMRSYHCAMNAPSADWILIQMDAVSTLENRYDVTSGLLGEHGPADPGNSTDKLESTLESLAMVGWGGSVDFDSPPIGDPTQGCMITHAEIPWPLFLFLVLATVGTFLMIVYWIVSSLQLRRLQSRPSSCTKLIKEGTPNGVLSWMTQAVREHIGYSSCPVEATDISGWNFGPDDKGRLTVSPGAGDAGSPAPKKRDKVEHPKKHEKDTAISKPDAEGRKVPESEVTRAVK